MTKPIANLNDAFDLFFEGGTIRLRLKEGITRETLLDEKLEKLKILIPDNHTWSPLFREAKNSAVLPNFVYQVPTRGWHSQRIDWRHYRHEEVMHDASTWCDVYDSR